jgi:hypothetical protein
MAWHIIFFLKSLRSLEEFRKNPHVKIPPKSTSTNFQSFGKFKNPIFIQKEFFLRIWPTRPSLARAGPLHTAGRRHACAQPILAYAALAYYQKPSLLRVCAARRRRLLPLSPPRGPRLSASSSPPRRLTRSTPPPRIATNDRPAPLGLHHCNANQSPFSPALIPPHESPLTPSPPINGVGRKSPAVTHRHFLPDAPPAPIKGEHHPRVAPHLSPLLFPSLHA